MSASHPVFRVFFSEPNLSRAAVAAIDALDGGWKGSEFSDDPIERHRALAPNEQEAVAAVREALSAYGAFCDFHATPVRDRHGAVKRTPIRRFWRDVDWEEVRRKVALSELERTLIGRLLDAAEPTWMVLRDPEVSGDRDRALATLRDLERRGLIHNTKEESGETGRESAAEDWWALTDEGWDLLGLLSHRGITSSSCS